jgi:gluconolactonase
MKLLVMVAGILAASPLWALGQIPRHPPPPAHPREGQPEVEDRLDELVTDRGPTLIASGFQFTEGPLWLPDRQVLIFSDIPANAIYEITPGEEPVRQEDARIYRRPSGNANGNALLPDGRIVSAQHNGQVTRVEQDGSVTVLASEYDGKRLNSPNDLVVSRNGAIYFTDPPFGVGRSDRKLDFSGIYRIAPDGTLTLLNKQLELPNGIAFSADQKRLYVSEYRKAQVLVFDVADDGLIDNPRVLISMDAEGQRGGADGLKVDTNGNIWTTGPGGVWVFSPEGKRLGQVHVRNPSNLCFGGPEYKTLFITAGPLVYSLETKVQGCMARD